MIRESIQYSIQFQKNDNSKNLQQKINIHQINLVPWITVQTKNKNCGYSQLPYKGDSGTLSKNYLGPALYFIKGDLLSDNSTLGQVSKVTKDC